MSKKVKIGLLRKQFEKNASNKFLTYIFHQEEVILFRFLSLQRSSWHHTDTVPEAVHKAWDNVEYPKAVGGRVVEIQTVGVGDVKDDKVWYAVREAQLAVHEALENIVFLWNSCNQSSW